MPSSAPTAAPAGSGLSIITSDRAEGLIERLAGDLGAKPLSPFDDEIVVVQSQGMRRWLRHELARRHGCAASIEFPFPAAFCQRLAGTRALGERRLDPRFERDALTWRILELLEAEIADEPVFAPLRRFLDGGDARKSLGLAARVADRFDDYLLYRPDTLLAWEAAPDEPLGHVHERWQAELWRRLCAGDEPPFHLARWFSEAIRRIESADALHGAPRRISVFGISSLPPLFVRLLQAVSHLVPVRYYILAPPSGQNAPGNPLFAAFGGAVRDLLGLVGEDAEHREIHEQTVITPTSVLRRLQHDVRQGVARGRGAGLSAPVPLAPRDDSLTVHICHSPMREMEVLRDQLLAAFAADPTLRPHDILLLVPDIALYAPFVEAVFGVGEPELPSIPHYIADRAVVHESAIADAALRILRLVGSRWTATEIVELLDVPSIRRAAGLGDGASEQVLRWLRDTKIRWGRDGAMRRDLFALPAVESNSWTAGLDRLLMGYAVGPDEQLFGGVLPSAGATMGDPETLGAFTQWVVRLFDLLDDCRRARPLAAWSGDLRAAFTALLAPDDDTEAEPFDRLLGVLDTLCAAESDARGTRDVDVALVRDWLERELADDSVGSGFLVGGMTICALKPMRSIPFRVIAIAGLDDAAFPRRNRRAAYDLLEIDPRRTDRNLRADDRQLFLDTLLSARDRLILSYVGRSAKSNTVRAASVVIAELLDHVDRTFDCAGGARKAIVTEHPLQPFSAKYYAGDEPEKFFSFSRANARVTAIAAAQRQAASPFVRSAAATGASAGDALHLTIGDLIDCWTNPSRFYLRRTLGVHLPGEEDPLEESEPMTVGGLAKYGIDERMLKNHLGGSRSPERERDQALAAGSLPSGELAGRWVDRLNDELSRFLDGVGRPVFIDSVMLDLRAEAWTLTGRVDGMIDGGRVQVRPARRKGKDFIRAWITHVALVANGKPHRTRVIGTDGECCFDDVADPMSILESLIAGYRAAAAAPMPVFEAASREFVERLRKDASPGKKGGKPSTKSPLDWARDSYRGSEWTSGDSSDAHHALCWRGRDPFAESRGEFEKWSMLLWEPALASMRDGGAQVVS